MASCPPSASAWRSLCNPERIRVFIVPRGWFNRAATSAYVNSEKNAASIAFRSSGVRTARALRSAWLCCLNAMRSSGLAVPVGGQRIPGFRRYALLALVEPQPVDGAGARLVHDPPKNGPVRLLVARCATPDIVEDVQRHFLGGFPVGGDSHDERENGAMGPFVQRVQCTLIARGDGLDERDPLCF